MVKERTFREDLYYRIKVVELAVPALRERGSEDLERLARHFVAVSARRHHLPEPSLSAATLIRLKAWHWPGNVRELENCIESAVVLSEGEILPEHLSLPDVGRAGAVLLGDAQNLTLAEVERRHVMATLERAKGNRTQAAQWLGIGRNTLARKLKSWGLGDEE
jgi:Nif-specific regulatory protein